MQRALRDLIDTRDPAWPMLTQWIAGARHSVDVLPAYRSQGEHTLLQLQVSTRSVLGAIALETGGMLIDHGWLRLLGSGHPRMRGTLLTWNGISDEGLATPVHGALLVGHDVVGGFFAVNGGAFPGEPGNVFYLAPDTLTWEDLALQYSGFVHWSLTGDLDTFYANARWDGWEQEIAALDGDHGLFIYPPLWAAGGSMSERHHGRVDMIELWHAHTKQRAEP
jgi:hypothetical protein